MFETLSVWESTEPNQHITANDWGFGVVILILNVFFFFFEISDLPPGWERIEDPVYGVYYVE